MLLLPGGESSRRWSGLRTDFMLVPAGKHQHHLVVKIRSVVRMRTAAATDDRHIRAIIAMIAAAAARELLQRGRD